MIQIIECLKKNYTGDCHRFATSSAATDNINGQWLHEDGRCSAVQVGLQEEQVRQQVGSSVAGHFTRWLQALLHDARGRQLQKQARLIVTCFATTWQIGLNCRVRCHRDVSVACCRFRPVAKCSYFVLRTISNVAASLWKTSMKIRRM